MPDSQPADELTLAIDRQKRRVASHYRKCAAAYMESADLVDDIDWAQGDPTGSASVIALMESQNTAEANRHAAAMNGQLLSTLAAAKALRGNGSDLQDALEEALSEVMRATDDEGDE